MHHTHLFYEATLVLVTGTQRNRKCFIFSFLFSVLLLLLSLFLDERREKKMTIFHAEISEAKAYGRRTESVDLSNSSSVAPTVPSLAFYMYGHPENKA